MLVAATEPVIRQLPFDASTASTYIADHNHDDNDDDDDDDVAIASTALTITAFYTLQRFNTMIIPSQTFPLFHFSIIAFLSRVQTLSATVWKNAHAV